MAVRRTRFTFTLIVLAVLSFNARAGREEDTHSIGRSPGFESPQVESGGHTGSAEPARESATSVAPRPSAESTERSDKFKSTVARNLPTLDEGQVHNAYKSMIEYAAGVMEGLNNNPKPSRVGEQMAAASPESSPLRPL